MKRFITVITVALIFVFAGCTPSPEKAAEKNFKASLKKMPGVKAKKIDIKKISGTKNKAVVEIKAKLDYSKKLTLVKKNHKWVVE
ncbi:MAG: hypothetical protein CSB21_01925 [Deltaproteobacteria bacterium]|nr:MAG: hypothetical protein CSB21_01925 [Deltaproteobacteria bacterium]